MAQSRRFLLDLPSNIAKSLSPLRLLAVLPLADFLGGSFCAKAALRSRFFVVLSALPALPALSALAVLSARAKRLDLLALFAALAI